MGLPGSKGDQGYKGDMVGTAAMLKEHLISLGLFGG